MAGGLAIIACGGILPVQIAKAHEGALIITLAGVPNNFGTHSNEHRLEKLGELFEALNAASVSQVVFAGALSRPMLDPAEYDPFMREIAPELQTSMMRGDAALLGHVIEIFEKHGLKVLGAHELLPELTAQAGLHVGPEPDARHLADIERAKSILQALSPLDVGQGCVVAKGQCLGIETAQGTDFMLRYVAGRPKKTNCGGIFLKAAKGGQDLRIDMPAIGPETIAGVVRAGLDGVVVEAEKVMILEREKTLQVVEDAGIFLISREF
jgi:DUF1009 family protein